MPQPGLDLLTIELLFALVPFTLVSSALAYAGYLLLSAKPSLANKTTYGVLQAHRLQVGLRLTGADPAAQATLAPMIGLIDSEMNSGSGLRWLTGTGYSNLFTFMHGLEEALVAFEAAPSLMRQATFARLRLVNSQVEQRQALLDRLEETIASLDQNQLDQARPKLQSVLHALNEFGDTRWAGWFGLQIVSSGKQSLLSWVRSSC